MPKVRCSPRFDINFIGLLMTFISLELKRKKDVFIENSNKNHYFMITIGQHLFLTARSRLRNIKQYLKEDSESINNF